MIEKSSINKKEVKQFSNLSKYWWNEKGPFKILHEMNKFRLQYIVMNIKRNFFNTNSQKTLNISFENLNILDIGCGGGILSEPLSKVGAKVTAVDASSESIYTAVKHSEMNNLKINYHNCSVETLSRKCEIKFDVVIALEIIEHVNNVGDFLSNCIKLTSSSGLFFFSTINRTVISFLGAIVIAEYILNIVPRKTHNWFKFPKPYEIYNILIKSNASVKDIQGMSYSLWRKEWKNDTRNSINYIGYAKLR